MPGGAARITSRNPGGAEEARGAFRELERDAQAVGGDRRRVPQFFSTMQRPPRARNWLQKALASPREE
ncbi:hypothetical protein SAMN05444276_102750 [Paracoccus sanguinis]|uniref:Uncharacterized protein n=1 Tax=Paracoccus sanguinis TaxID=1545044 RepID=A0A1H2Y643_9RHOB|nr:hypothetical protein SAMN05444276_102750 [Paracoccus sanguinis]